VTVGRTLSFLRAITHVSVANFLWIDDSPFGFTDHVSPDLPERFISDYQRGIGVFDPLSIGRTLRFRTRIGNLASADVRASSERCNDYLRFLNGYGVVDEVHMAFMVEGEAIATASLMRRPSDPEFSHREDYWINIRDYVQHALQLHARFQELALRRRLEWNFGLTAREREVAMLIANGAANHDIACILGIGLATVKTHVIHILDKLAVGGRQGVMALCRSIAAPGGG
jgi:DNA-binding CsgD family transcriptional regulator